MIQLSGLLPTSFLCSTEVVATLKLKKKVANVSSNMFYYAIVLIIQIREWPYEIHKQSAANEWLIPLNVCLLKEFLLIKCCTAAFAYSCSWQRQTYFSFNSNIEFTGIVLKLSIFKDFMDHMIIHFMESFGCDYCFLKTSKTLLIRCNSEIWLKFLCFCVCEWHAFFPVYY